MFNNRFIPVSRNEFLGGILILLSVTFIVAGLRWSVLYDGQAISSEQTSHLYLEERTDLEELSSILADSSYIKNEKEFNWAANLLGWRKFQRGHYLIDKPYGYEEFLSKLARGIQDPVNVTILPGRSEGDIVQRVANQLKFDSLSFHQTIRDTSLLGELNLAPKDVIGRLYPNTYSVYWTISTTDFFRRINSEFTKRIIRDHKEQFEKLELSVNEVVTLASIVEWEARSSEEKKTISGLYWNRLNRGMRLQADPTVNFAVGERRRLLYEDYRIDHPYNTYQYRGLPPGPITNPDAESIRAALYPEDHDYLYMVATPNGEHAFSKTFEEHKQKSAKWRQWLQEQYRIKRMNEQDNANN